MTESPIPALPHAVVPAGRMSAVPQPGFPLSAGRSLRPWVEDDAPALVRAGKDRDIRFWNRLDALDLEGARQRIVRWRQRWEAEAAALWAVAASDGTAVGLLGLADVDTHGGSAEFLYWLLPEGRGGGVMVEAVRRVTDWAFEEVGLHRLRITHSLANTASCRIAHAAGFGLEGTMRSALRHADGWHDEHLHARIEGDPLT